MFLNQRIDKTKKLISELLRAREKTIQVLQML